ncbi:LPP20 family lipoprotein [Helicobacter trogontum]|uniref:LPP20 family lipoprotein n=1 Tax=Helicobacter trogontum TaxID=50960 RepID=A0A4U8SBH9_9HELI|nr:LPP20 family lipoprotein [Helicobacter trogontum]TLD83404.1 hypothetical protein LS81_004775 [Helicobacter trogontum]
MQKYLQFSYIFIYTLISIVLLSLYGCKDVKNASLNKDKPSKDYIYGEGSGVNFDLAKQYALQDLATNLQVSIRYSTQQNIAQHNNTLQTSGISNTLLESKIKDIPSVEVEKTTKKDNRVNVRVRVSKEVLEGSIRNRIIHAQNDLQTILQTCNQVSFSQYKKFKTKLSGLKEDIALYQALTKNMSYGNAMILDFQNMISTYPSYALHWELNGLYNYQNDIQAIITTELSKFIKINPQAKQTLYIKANNDNPLQFLLQFYDCKNNLENAIQINTHASKNDMLQGSKKSRLGAIIYKALNDMY